MATVAPSSPDIDNSFFAQGLAEARVQVQQGNFHQALAVCEHLSAHQQESAEVCIVRGIALGSLGHSAEALQQYDRAIQLKPDSAAAHNNRGNLLRRLQRPQEALADFDRAIAIKPRAETWYNRGLVLQELGRAEEALASYDESLALNPDYADAHNNCGALLQQLQRPQEALAAYERALALRPELADAWNNRGNALRELQRLPDALSSYSRAISLRPDFAAAYNNAGLALHKLGRHTEAVASFDRAIALKPDYAEACNNLGNTFKEMKQLEQAVACYARAVAIRPDFAEALGSWVQNKMHACDWNGMDDAFAAMARAIETGAAIVPFNVLATPLSAARQHHCALSYTAARFPAQAPLTGAHTRYRHARIRLGYFSADLHNHATAYLMAELFERHDRSQFELIAFSFGPAQEDAMRSRTRQAFDQFHDVRTHSDFDIARLARELEIDIAVDLKGYTRGARPGILAHRPAPIQVNYLGYPGTLGADYIDYLIADPLLIPPEARQHYTEKIAYLPDTYQVNDRRRVVSERAATRADHGLPADALVFCCFNNNYKITPDVFNIWMRLLAQVEHSVLWLFEANPTAMRNLRQAAEQHGIPANRLIFAHKLPQAEHLARYHHADLVLDTFHYNAHTTTSDALWVGCPVLTCIGSTFPGRVAASLLAAHGMPELITASPEEYETTALALARDPLWLADLRLKAIVNRDSHALFDTARFARNIESLYRQMHARHQAGQSPEHIETTA